MSVEGHTGTRRLVAAACVGLGVALFAAGGVYGWFVESLFAGVESRIPLHGFADPGAVIWLTVIPAALVVIAPFRGRWPLVLWLACLPLVGLVLAAWFYGRGVIWNGGVAEAFSAGLVVSSVGAGAVFMATTLAVALRN
jgi:hypothetical protein